MSYTDTDTRYNIELTSANRENYWRYYGLKQDPFAVTLEGEPYLPPRWEQYIDLLHYLCHSKNVMLMVTGSKRAGKTIFLRFFLEHFYKEPVRICHLAASASLTAANLIAAIAKDFTLPQAVGETMEEKLEEYLTDLQQTPELCLLVVDNAHRLPRDTIESLLFLIKHQSESQMRLHIVLVGETHLQQSVMMAAQEEDIDDLLHNITLEPFTLDETTAYIKYRLEMARLPAAIPFSKSTLIRIHNLSEGIPGRINVVARQVLIDAMRQRQLYSFVDYIRSRRVKFSGAAVFLILFMMVFYFLTHNNHLALIKPQNLFADIKLEKKKPVISVNSHTEKSLISSKPPVIANAALPKAPPASSIVAAEDAVTLNTVQITYTKVPPPAPLVATVSGNTIILQHKNVQTNSVAAPNPMTAAASHSMPAAPAIVPHAVSAPAPMVIHPSDPVIQQHFAPVASPPSTPDANAVSAKTIEVAKPTSIVPEVKPAAVKLPAQKNSATSNLNSLNELMSYHPASFTIQLVGVSNEAAIKRFIATNHLTGHAVYYHTNRTGKDWYVLLYGHYDNAAAANAGIKKLSGNLQSLHPFPRTVGSVRSSVLR